MLNLTQLRYFELVAQTGSFAQACAMANITQPALSNAIKSLEERLGFQLFDRKERPIQLTAHGQSLLAEVERLLFQARNLDITVQALRDGAAGHVRLGMTAAFASAFGGRSTAKWLKENPRMTLDVLVRPTPVLVDKLLAEELDVIVGITSALMPEAAQLEMLPLGAQPGRAFVRQGHPILAKPELHPQDLQDFGLAGSHYAPSVLAQFADWFGYAKVEDLPLVVDSENTSLICDLTVNSDLVMLSIRDCTRHYVAQGALVEVDLDLQTLANWSVATRRGRRQLPGAEALVSVVQQIAGRGEAAP
ncbi:Cyn operon transcriptional activator [Thalassovita autumnalis]|uniref:Cyn operon transcriptional activator n=1 Tax=Thalassovita autumnalis TaxID=2072972 RepID=A0A0P1FT27_9RHOB|nr:MULTISPECIES: LysR family transcriptional regulator [Thalassovita]CUH66819.1 Cyn operon transcriptional activator [Thalassovita autumnalis]CUH71520.1 Cyn operon transcriptional activator [Thalassovita autumnalis]